MPLIYLDQVDHPLLFTRDPNIPILVSNSGFQFWFPNSGTMFLVKLHPEASHGFKSWFNAICGCRISILVPAKYSQGLGGPTEGQKSKTCLRFVGPKMGDKPKSGIFPERSGMSPGSFLTHRGIIFGLYLDSWDP